MAVTEVNPVEVLRAFVGRYKTRTEAASALGIAPSFIAEIEKGFRRMPDRVLDKLGLRRAVIRETRKAKP